MALDTLPSWVCVYMREGHDAEQVTVDHWPELDAAYCQWIERRIDRALALTSITGAELIVSASAIVYLYKSTPETRAKSKELDEATKQARGYRDSE